MDESFSTINELLAHFDSIFNTKVSNLLIITLNWLEGIFKELWNLGLTEADGSVKSVIAKNWHDSWNNMGSNSSCSAIFNPFKVNLGVVEQLCNHAGGTGILFLFKELNFIFITCHIQWMHFWISCNDNAEIISEIFFDESNELIGI